MDRYVMMYRDADVEGIFMCEDQGCVRWSAGGGCLLGLHARFSVKRLTGERMVGGLLRFSTAPPFLNYGIAIGFNVCQDCV